MNNLITLRQQSFFEFHPKDGGGISFGLPKGLPCTLICGEINLGVCLVAIIFVSIAIPPSSAIGTEKKFEKDKVQLKLETIKVRRVCLLGPDGHIIKELDKHATLPQVFAINLDLISMLIYSCLV